MNNIVKTSDTFVSVPLWGLFNLTGGWLINESGLYSLMFPSPYGDYLI